MRSEAEIDSLAVVGSSGFLGRELIEALAARPSSPAVRALDREDYPEEAARPEDFESRVGKARDVDVLTSLLDEVDAVWVRAGITGGPRSAKAELAEEYLEGNTRVVDTVLDACERTDCRRVFFDSTEQAFGRSGDLEVQEVAAEPAAGNYYGASKAIAEKRLRLWARDARDGGSEARSVQIFRYSRVRADQTRDVIFHMASAALDGEPIRVFGDGGHRVSLVHTDDVIGANVAALDRRPEFAVWNVSSGRPVSLMELARRVRECVRARTGGGDVPIERHPADSKERKRFEPYVVGMQWEESLRRLGRPMPVGLDAMIERSVEWLAR